MAQLASRFHHRPALFPLPLLPAPASSARALRHCMVANDVVSGLNRLVFPGWTSEQVACSPSRGQARLQSFILDSARRYRCVCFDVPFSDHFVSDFSSLDLPSGLWEPPIDRPADWVFKADMVKLPEVAGQVDLLAHLPEPVSSCYSWTASAPYPPDCFKRPAEVLGESFPVYYPTGVESETSLLLRRLFRLGMVSFILYPLAVNGLFTVMRSDGKERLIIDARNAARFFSVTPDPGLPGPDVLPLLEFTNGSSVYIGVDDTSSFYDSFSVPPWLRQYFCLPALGAAALVYPIICTLPQGFSHSVFLAQASHLNIISQRCPLAGDVLVRGCDMRLDRPRVLVYVEMCLDLDFLRWWFELRKRSMLRRGSDCVALGLLWLGPRSFSRQICSVGLHPRKLRDLVSSTQDFLVRRTVTERELSRLLGKWCWCILVRRPAFAVLQQCFSFALVKRNVQAMLWGRARAELEILVLIARLLWAIVSPPWFPLSLASDSSMTGGAVVALPFLSFASKTPSQRWTDFSWSLIASWRWEFDEHINVLELRAFLVGLRWVLSCHASGLCTLRFLLDSQVVLGALRKGRSSYQLLCLL
eukprot:g65346.t1